MNVSTIGLDIAKSVFQVHGEDSEGKVVIRKRLGRKAMMAFFANAPPVSGLEACGRRTIGAARCGRLGTRFG